MRYQGCISVYSSTHSAMRIYYGYSCMYVKMREDDYMDFLKENTQNGKWKEVNELKYSGKKAHLHSCYNAK